MVDVWYYAQNDKSVGPLSLADLTSILSRVSDIKDVLVWRNGFEHWKRAADVPELAAPVLRPPPLPPRPPPLGSEPQLRALLSEVSAVSTPVASEKPASRWGKSAKGIVSFLVIMTAFAIARSISQHSSSQTSPPDPRAQLSGAARQKTCMQKQENDPDTKALSISKDALTKYCSCYMNTLADSVTFGEIAGVVVKDGKPTFVPPAMQKKVESADGVCLESFRKSLMGG
jgi:GYF domain 2